MAQVYAVDSLPVPWWLAVPGPPPGEAGQLVVHQPGMAVVVFQDRRYRIHAPQPRPGVQAPAPVALMLWKDEAAFHIDQVELDSDAERRRFATDAAQECGLTAAEIVADLELIVRTVQYHRQGLFMLLAGESAKAH